MGRARENSLCQQGCLSVFKERLHKNKHQTLTNFCEILKAVDESKFILEHQAVIVDYLPRKAHSGLIFC